MASRSAGKLRELRPIFAASGWAVMDLSEAGIPEDPAAEDAIEAFETFEENALAKARHFAGITGRPVIADDSGLMVAALGGAPGVRSKRWSAAPGVAGASLVRANNARLVEALRDAGDRSASFVCVAAFVDGRVEIVERGEVPGQIVLEPRGEQGFGYDPHFAPDGGDGRTFAELSVAEKQGFSHRGRAFAGLIARMRQLGVGA